MIGLVITSVGNHEFDEGKAERLNGGCHPEDGCQGPHAFTGAKFHYLAASTIETATGKSILPPYEIREFDGIPVAFIGLTPKGTAGIVSPKGIIGLEFRDEADTERARAATEGAGRRGNRRPDPRRRRADLRLQRTPGHLRVDRRHVKKFDRAVDVVVSGHTHRAHVCQIDPRLVTSGDKYGTLVTEIDSPSIPRRATSSARKPRTSSSPMPRSPRIQSRPR